MLCYPCRCLCFGVLQITRITRFLLITLQRTQIFFTDGLTFMTLDFRYFKTSDAGQFFLWKDRTDSSQPSRDLLATNECNALVSFLKYARGFHARCRVEREKSFLGVLLSLPRPYESRPFHFPYFLLLRSHFRRILLKQNKNKGEYFSEANQPSFLNCSMWHLLP